MRYLFLLTILFSVGCSCQTENAFKKIWCGHVKKLYNWVLADNEASKYKDREAAARAYFGELRKLNDPRMVATKLRRDGFHWHKENVDFTSWAWVTIARKRGDCDDFMHLWEELAKGWEGRTKRVSVSSKDGGGHAMLLYYKSTLLFLFSNLRVLGKGVPGDEEDLIKKFYGDRTRCWIIY